MTAAFVVGGGVAGLTCALRLAESGFHVTLAARDFFPRTTSAVAAAVWYPYRAYPPDRVLGWAASSLQRFQQFSANPRSGVSLVELREYFPAPAADPWWKPAVPEFRRLQRSDIAGEFADGCSIRVPLMETEKYLPFLTGLLEQRGVRIEQRVIKNLDECDSDIVVNCSGLGARDLCHDNDLFPIPWSGREDGETDRLKRKRGPRLGTPRSDLCDSAFRGLRSWNDSRRSQLGSFRE